MAPMNVKPGRKPGRKRSEESRLAILTAALELVGEVGYARLTIEGIAARSGAGKQTIYRWWPSKADVLFDALAAKADLHVPITDQGSYREDLRAFLDGSFRLSGPVVEGVLRALMAHAQVDEAFGARFRESFLRRRRDALGEIVERARERGDLPPGISPGTVADVVFGVIWYRVLARDEPPGPRLTEELITALS
jgi:AcrR family transcriptional regulator